MAGYRPQLFLRTADSTVGLAWPEDAADKEKMVSPCTSLASYFSLGIKVMPGDNVEMVCSLHHDVAAEVGSR